MLLPAVRDTATDALVIADNPKVVALLAAGIIGFLALLTKPFQKRS